MQGVAQGSSRNAWLLHRSARLVVLALHSGDPSLLATPADTSHDQHQHQQHVGPLQERYVPVLREVQGAPWRGLVQDVLGLLQVGR